MLYLVKAWVSGFRLDTRVSRRGDTSRASGSYSITLSAHLSFFSNQRDAPLIVKLQLYAWRLESPSAAGLYLWRGILSEVWGMPEKARRVLQAAAVEAYGRPGMYVVMAQVMQRANISDLEEFRAIARHLEESGCTAEADPDYGVFVLTPEGIDEALK